MSTKKSIANKLWSSGFVNRYHSHESPILRNSQDLTDAHSNRMVKLLLFLFPERAKNSKLITHIVMHDAGEFLSGDGPYSAKMANPDLRLALDVIEDFQLEEFYSFFSEAEDRFLDEEDKPVVKLLDLLDSFLYQAVHDPVRTSTEFRLYSDILRRACVLNVFASVNGLIGNALYVNNIKMKEVK